MSALISAAVKRLADSLSTATGGANIGFQQAGAGTIKRTISQKAAERPSLQDFGAVNDGAIDATPAVEAARTNGVAHVEFPPGTYKVNNFRTLPNTVYKGIGKPIIAFNFTSASAWLGFQSGSLFDGIVFQSNEANLPWQRGAVEDAVGVTLRDCAFKGFRDAAAAPNAWGVHIARSTGVMIDNCEFSNNSQADIAITDAVRDVTIINARNPTDNGVLLNVEPNTQDGVDGLNVIGGHYRQVWLQEMENRGYAGRNMVFQGARVDALYYDGSGARFIGCDIGTIGNAPDGVGAVYAGALMIDTCDLSPNLVNDPYLFDISNDGVTPFWNVYTTGAAPFYKRINDPAYGKYLRINPNKAAGDYYPVTMNNIAVTAGETLLFFIRARCDNTSIAGIWTGLAFVQWKNGAGATISTTNIKTCRGAFASFTDWSNDVAVLVPPAGAVGAKLYVGVTGNVFADVASVGLFRPSVKRSGMGNMQDVIGKLSRPNTEREFSRASAPAGAQQWPGYFVGERIVNSAPAPGQPRAWICSVAGVNGNPGTWTIEGNL